MHAVILQIVTHPFSLFVSWGKDLKMGAGSYRTWVRNKSRMKIAGHEDHQIEQNCDAEPLETLFKGESD